MINKIFTSIGRKICYGIIPPRLLTTLYSAFITGSGKKNTKTKLLISFKQNLRKLITVNSLLKDQML